MNYNECIRYLEEEVGFGSVPGLERIQALCNKLGNPEQKLSVKTDMRKAAAASSTSNSENLSIAYRELKIGKLANTVLRRILQDGSIPADELQLLQDKEYSKRVFDLQYPVLVKDGTDYESVRYYSTPIEIDKERYYLCSQWFETPANNDRPYLEKWISQHQ